MMSLLKHLFYLHDFIQTLSFWPFRHPNPPNSTANGLGILSKLLITGAVPPQISHISVGALRDFDRREESQLAGHSEAIYASSDAIYRPLEEHDSIRLLTLCRAPNTDTLSFHLFQTRLSSRKYRYFALSYEWGTESPDDPEVLINGQWVRIRRNLFDALYQIRNRHTRIGGLWIDALCIDQNSIHERNHQVQIMGRIYDQAEKVIAWVGNAGFYGDLAIATFERIQAAAEETGSYRTVVHVEGEEYSEAVEKRLNLEGRSCKVRLSASEIQAMVSFVRRSYWRRMWIIQEIRKAKQLSIYCGTRSISRTSLQHVAQILYASPSRRVEEIWSSFAFLLLRPNISGESRLSYWLHFCTNWGCECTDPRDIVYALLGIASDCQNGEIQVDYSIPALAMYTTVIRFLMKDHLKDGGLIGSFEFDGVRFQRMTIISCLMTRLGLAEADVKAANTPFLELISFDRLGAPT
jgi:Heterokaryon incompatibility protein (HET)